MFGHNSVTDEQRLPLRLESISRMPQAESCSNQGRASQIDYRWLRTTNPRTPLARRQPGSSGRDTARLTERALAHSVCQVRSSYTVIRSRFCPACVSSPGACKPPNANGFEARPVMDSSLHRRTLPEVRSLRAATRVLRFFSHIRTVSRWPAICNLNPLGILCWGTAAFLVSPYGSQRYPC